MLTPDEWSALLLSIRVSLWSVALMLLPGIGCAWLQRKPRFCDRQLGAQGKMTTDPQNADRAFPFPTNRRHTSSPASPFLNDRD